jgi:hypothetical protein
MSNACSTRCAKTSIGDAASWRGIDDRRSAELTFRGKDMNDGYRCELCGAWVEYRNLSTVLAHEGPLPHVEQDRPAVGNGTDRERRKK